MKMYSRAAIGMIAGIALIANSAAAANLTGAGSTFVFPLISKWAGAYKDATGNQINYQSIGSGGGATTPAHCYSCLLARADTAEALSQLAPKALSNVRYWRKADIGLIQTNGRFWGKADIHFGRIMMRLALG